MAYQVSEDAYRLYDAYNVREKWFRAAVETFIDFPQNNGRVRAALQQEADRLRNFQAAGREVTPSLVDNQEMKIRQKLVDERISKQLPKELATLIKKNAARGTLTKEVLVRMKNRYVRALNDQPWRPIKTRFSIGNKTYINRLTPVNQHFDVNFNGYNETGSSSMTPSLTGDGAGQAQIRTNNLWLSEFYIKTNQEPKALLFEAFRSGSLSSRHTEADAQTRFGYAVSKVSELYKAILIRHIKSRLESGENETTIRQNICADQPYTINVVSISLQTPTTQRLPLLADQAEWEMVNDQVRALRQVAANCQRNTIRVNNINFFNYNIRFKVFPFVFGVNAVQGGEGGSGVLNQFYSDAIARQTAINRESLNQFRTMYMELYPTFADRQLPLLKALLDQVSGNLLGINYEVPAKIANLAYQTGCFVHFNCKSGKDRTSVMDAESKLLADILNQYNMPPIYQNVINEDTNSGLLFRKLLFESGNLELQAINTGARGYKLLEIPASEPGLRDRIGDYINLLRGLCGVVEAKPSYDDHKVPITDEFLKTLQR